MAAAQAFFRKALSSVAPRVPRKITLDGRAPSCRALWLLRREHPYWRNVEVRTNRYLNNVIEQDHRAIKQRCASMAGFKSFTNAAVVIAGIELAHRIRKRQFHLGRTYRRRPGWSLRTEWAIARSAGACFIAVYEPVPWVSQALRRRRTIISAILHVDMYELVRVGSNEVMASTSLASSAPPGITDATSANQPRDMRSGACE